MSAANTFKITCSCKREGRVSQPVANGEWEAESVSGWVYRNTASFDEQGVRVPIGWYCGRDGHWQEHAEVEAEHSEEAT